MKYDAAIDAIKTRWLTLWPAASETAYPAQVGGLPTIFENDKSAEPSPPTVWTEVVVETQPEEAMTIGKPTTYRTRGTIWIRVNYPAVGAGGADDGTKWLNRLAVAALGIMASKQFAEGPNEDGIITYTGAVLTEGVDQGQRADEGLWWILAIAIRFEYTDVR